MTQSPFSLKAVDSVKVMTIMDNYTDVLLTNTDVVTRPPLAKGGNIPSDALLAEHGLSMLVTVFQGKNKHTILFDTGYTKVGVPHNLALLQIDLEEVEAIALSHGHMDHTGSLYLLLDKLAKRIALVVHPDAFLAPRYFGLADGRKLLFPKTLVREKLEHLKVDVLERKTPTLIADDTVMITGEVERVTAFEKGLPNATMERDGKLENDPIADDQALVVKLKGGRLIVISGCAHSGIINTVFYARKITGVKEIHAILGGFHLSGPFFEQIIEDTIRELKGINPKVLVPMHCTGWKAIQRFSEEFPSSFILNSVGSLFTLS